MRVVIPTKRDLRYIPPLASVARGLSMLGIDVDVVSYHCSTSVFPDQETERGPNLVTCSERPYPQRGLARRARASLAVYRSFARVLTEREPVDVVWIGSSDFTYFRRVAQRHAPGAVVVFQCHEYEEATLKFCRLADLVVVPEKNRAWITAFAAGLSRRPLVLPNIPIGHPRVAAGQADEKLTELHADGKLVLLYQGLMDVERRCLPEILLALRLCPERVSLALMPSSVPPQEVRSHIDRIATDANVAGRVHWLEPRVPPAHLDVVGQADIGIGLYRPTSINQVYCAPNRLYEFTGFGIPVVLPDFPGVAQVAARCQGVVVCDPTSPESIAKAVSSLVPETARGRAQAAAVSFFDREGDYLERLRQIAGSVLGVA